MGLQFKWWHVSFWSVSWRDIPKRDKKMFGIMLLLHATIAIFFAFHQQLHCDENDYWSYALRWAQGNPERVHLMDDSKTPLMAPSLLPIVLKFWFPSLAENYGYGLLRLGRIFMYVYTALAAFIMFIWLYRFLGNVKWALPLLLFLIDPLIISYSMLVNSDLASGALLVLIAYTLYRYIESKKWRYWIWLSFAFAGGVLLKQSLVFAIPMAGVVLLLYHLLYGGKKQAGFWIDWIKRWAVAGLIVLSCVNLTYYGKDSFRPLNALEIQSKQFQTFANKYPGLASLPLPLPLSYVASFDWLIRNKEVGGGFEHKNSYTGVFILGEYKTKGGFWYYYLVLFWYKMPLIIQLLLFGALLHFIVQRKWRTLSMKHWSVLWPVVGFGVLLSFFNPFQIGIRHAIIILPFLYLGIAPFIASLVQHKKKWLMPMLLFNALSLGWHWPNLIAYTQELAGPKRLLYQKMKDSSIYYCTQYDLIIKFIAKNPDYKYATELPESGQLVADIEHVAAASLNTQHPLRWLVTHFEPIDHYRNNVLIYHITEDDFARLKLAN